MGKLTIIMGCMFSGKSTELLRLYRRYIRTYAESQIMVINHSLDERYGNNVVSTHDKMQIPSIMVNDLKNLRDNEQYQQSKIIFIEEAQFFKNLKESVVKAVDLDQKIVYVFGLDGDFKREKFGEILDLIPYCDDIIKLKAICHKCTDGTEAIFTKRISKSKEQTLVGSENSYIAVCRKHFLET
jgi:thymidine kinase